MNDPAHTPAHNHGAEAWLRHYAEAAERRRTAAAQHRPQARPYLQYRQREARWARLIVLLAAGLLIAWAYFFK
jgi:hypothetical protein